MPNWCQTTYAVVGDKKEVKELYNLMNELENMDAPLVKNGFGKTWLGCLVKKLGGDPKEVDCRGEWFGVEFVTANQINFETSTAWGPCNEVLDLVKNKFPSLSYYYITEEPGCSLYETNDADGEYFNVRYKVSVYYKDEYYDEYYDDHFDNETEIIDWLNYEFDADLKTLDDVDMLVKRLQTKDADAFINIYPYNIVR